MEQQVMKKGRAWNSPGDGTLGLEELHKALAAFIKELSSAESYPDVLWPGMLKKFDLHKFQSKSTWSAPPGLSMRIGT